MDKRMDEELKKIIVFIIVGVLLIGGGVTSKMHRGIEKLPENCEAEIIFDDYIAQDGVITFNCKVYLGNHSSEDKYYKMSGDFRAEYNAKMIDERVLPCYDTETDYEIFFVPAQTEGIFEVSFTSTGDETVKKPDRLSPTLSVKEISTTLVDEDKFVKNDVYIGINGNNDVF